jgi:hypothetical protein
MIRSSPEEHMARPFVVSVVVAVVVSSAACAEDITAENYSAALNEARCRHLVNCGVLDNLDDCHRALQMFAIPLDSYVAAALEAGKMVFHTASARGCVEAIAADSCDFSPVLWPPPDICAQAFGGTVPGGGTCAFGGECISQSCDVTPCDDACCTGTCVGDRPQGLPQLGEPCGTYGACAARLLCNGATCETRLPAGATCRAPYECDDGLFCDDGPFRSGTCVPLAEFGESCGQCRDLGAVCGSRNVCVKAALGGDACGPERPCSRYYSCGRDSRCALLTYNEVTVGDGCGGINDRCAGERVLCLPSPDRSASTCVQILLDGEPCEPDAQDQLCWSGACDPETHTCSRSPVCL